MQAYRITNWHARYEVTSRNHRASAETPPGELRKSRLDYIRSKVYGHSIGPGLQAVFDKGWRPGEINEWAVFGLFCKLLELAADQERSFRGWILDKDQQPMGAAAIAKLFHTPEVERLEQALDLLCNEEIRWLEVAEFETTAERIKCINKQKTPHFPGIAGNPRNRRESPESAGLFKNEDESEYRRKKTQMKGKTEGLVRPDDSSSLGLWQVRQRAKLLINECVKPQNQSDHTTISDILSQLELRVKAGGETVEIFSRLVEQAASARAARKPLAAFIAAAKRGPFNYEPVQRRSATGLAGSLKNILSKF